jgi:hypothetical protein
MKLIMTLLVRDEEDIIEANLDFHLSHGVDFFIITDNLSVDGTRDIIESYVRSGVALCLKESRDDYSQFRWVTRMARMAVVNYGADWVINSDADEFWVGSNERGDLKLDLAASPLNARALLVPRSNFIPVDEAGAGFFAERMTLRELRSFNTEGGPLPPKVCHRGLPDVEVDQGNHGVRRAGVALPAVISPLRILHYPVRSYKQFENKIVKGGAAYARNTELSPDVGSTWRGLYDLWQNGGLRSRYIEMVPSPLMIQRRIVSGELLYDDTVLHALRSRDRVAIARTAA